MPNPRINFDEKTMDLLRADVDVSEGALSLSEVVRRAVNAWYETKSPTVDIDATIADVTVRLDEWMLNVRCDNQIYDTEEFRFRELLNTLNHEIHHCINHECDVDTWTGAVDMCPSCGNPGQYFGRRLQ